MNAKKKEMSMRKKERVKKGMLSRNKYFYVLHLQDVSYFPDGRSVVNTIGGRRFKVLSRAMREGYHTAKVEFIKDELETEPADLQSKLHRLYRCNLTDLNILENLVSY